MMADDTKNPLRFLVDCMLVRGFSAAELKGEEPMFDYPAHEVDAAVDWIEKHPAATRYDGVTRYPVEDGVHEEPQYTIPQDIRERAASSNERVKLTLPELIEAMDQADDALNGDSNDAEHDALYALRELLSEWYEDPERRWSA